MIEELRRCFREDKVFYTRHARNELLSEEFGVIADREVEEAIQSGEEIENYPDDEPFPSVLIFRGGARCMWFAPTIRRMV